MNARKQQPPLEPAHQKLLSLLGSAEERRSKCLALSMSEIHPNVTSILCGVLELAEGSRRPPMVATRRGTKDDKLICIIDIRFYRSLPGCPGENW